MAVDWNTLCVKVAKIIGGPRLTVVIDEFSFARRNTALAGNPRAMDFPRNLPRNGDCFGL